MLQVGLMTQHRIYVQQTYLVQPSNYRPLHLNFFIKNNHLKDNSGKSRVLRSAKKPEIISIDGIPLAASSHEKLLRVTIDSELKFENHITELCLNVSKKRNALLPYIKFHVIRKTQSINESIYRIFLDSEKLKIVQKEIITFFKRRVSIIL